GVPARDGRPGRLRRRRRPFRLDETVRDGRRRGLDGRPARPRSPRPPGGIVASSITLSSWMKKIGFLSFGAWHPAGGLTRSAGDALRQTVELAVAAEEIGIDGAFVRVHHFARQLASPFPLLAAIGVKTNRIEIGTGVIDMRYENPLYMAEDAAAADLLAGG